MTNVRFAEVARPSRPSIARDSAGILPSTAISIERVEPTLDGGDNAAKRIVGERIEVSADVFKDGHDRLGVALLVKREGEARPRQVPMRLVETGLDGYGAELELDRIGRWTFAVEAWVDRFASWREAASKRLAAGERDRLDLVEGERIVRAAMERCAPGAASWGRDFDERDARARKRVSDEIGSLPALSFVDAMAILLGEEVGHFLTLWGERTLRTRSREYPLRVDRHAAGFAAWYELFPRSEGGLIGAAARLPAIAKMGFDVVYLPPVHPIGETFRKGKNNALTAQPGDVGSPWAIGSAAGGHDAIEPSLGTLDDFDRFVREAAKHGIEVALDYALQCSPDHPWVKEHPEWFRHRVDGTIQYAENPPKKYQDIYPFEFWGAHREALWRALRGIVLFWIGHGVRTFRVDNPHTKPLEFWRWLIQSVQRRHPEVVFLAEAFTRPSPMRALAKAGFTQSYTYFTWKNDRAGLEELVDSFAEMGDYYRPNLWPNTPDILSDYLVRGGRPAFLVRALLAATLSPLYGIYSGYELCENVPLREASEEYLDSEKYESKTRDWASPSSIAPFFERLNHIRRNHPALQTRGPVAFHRVEEDPSIVVYSKTSADLADVVIVAVCLDPKAAHWGWVELDLEAIGVGPDEPFVVRDLLRDEVWSWRGSRAWIKLDPAHDQVGHLFVIERGGRP